MSEDPFKGLVWHHERVDWLRVFDDGRGGSLARQQVVDKLSNLFMGKQLHWSQLQWVKVVKGVNIPMTPLEIERSILVEAGNTNWNKTSPVGKPYYQHFLTLMKLMFPKTDITNTLADAVMVFCIAVATRKKIMNLIGCQNSSKSATMARIAFVTMFINPEFTYWEVSNPFDNAADSTIWGEVELLWDDLTEAHPHHQYGNQTSLFPEGVRYANKRIEFIPKRPRAARIVLNNIKHSGKSKGSKSRKGANNEDIGIKGQMVDEINEIENQSFLKTIVNLSSQKNYICTTSQNYKDPDDMGGVFTEPVPLFGGPDNVEKLDVDVDILWHSKEAGITLRFDGHKAANILAKRTVYSYLFDNDDLERITLNNGVESPLYASQVRSFPVLTSQANSVLSKAKISASRHKDPFFAMESISGIVAFCDPAFGGADSAVWGCCRFGPGIITDAGGAQFKQNLIVFTEQMKVVKLVREARWNDFWLDKLKSAGINTSGIETGALVSYEDQIAIQCALWNRERAISADAFGYDFSLRPDIVSSMNMYVGFPAQAFCYNRAPEGVPLEGSKEQSEDACKNRCTELAMLAADFFLTKQLRGGEFIETAVVQLSRTHKTMVNRKWVVEDKAEYKQRWQNVSPDNRDVLMGLAGMAVRKGFRSVLKSAAAGPASQGVFAKLRLAKQFRNRVAVKIK